MDDTLQPKSTEPVGQCALVVDDDPIIRGILRSLLTDAGYTVVTAASGREALDLASNLNATIAVLDLNMPDGNGLQTCAALRQNPRWHSVPILILTSYSVNKALDAALGAGADGFFCKPIDPAELLEAVAVHIGRKAVVKPGLQVVRDFDVRLALDTAGMPADSLLPVGSEWILR